jgi:UDP-N-acetylmuramoylalanine--D-glutamate ligase
MRLDALATADVLILGFGREGKSSYEFLRAQFPSKKITIADTQLSADAVRADPLVTFATGADYEPAILGAQVIVKTAGIPAAAAILRAAVSNGARLTSHIEIFFANYPRERIVGVTGTKGKSTTTTLLYEMVKAAGMPSVVAGNIGAPPLTQVDLADPKALVICELSSHQLQPLTISPHIAILTNVVPEHLDYYATFEEYVAAKENITRFQDEDDVLVYGSDSEICRAIASRTGAKTLPVSIEDGIVESILPARDVPLRGRFNLANVAAAIAAARLLGVGDDRIRAAIKAFKPLPHRLQHVGCFREIDFYDDSIATVPEAAALAIEALAPDVQTLIAGGHDRHLTFEVLADAIAKSKIDTLILFPPTGEKIAAAVESSAAAAQPFRAPKVFFVESMEEAVRLAYQHTARGRTCLLSPASASFGTFADYADRGQQFERYVRQLGA